MQGHDLEGMERFHQDTRHMVTLDVLNNGCPVGTKGERYPSGTGNTLIPADGGADNI